MIWAACGSSTLTSCSPTLSAGTHYAHGRVETRRLRTLTGPLLAHLERHGTRSNARELWSASLIIGLRSIEHS